MKISMVDCNEAQLEETCTAIRDSGGEVRNYSCDVGNNSEVQKTFGLIRTFYGAFDAVICCAAVGDSSWKKQFKASSLQHVLNVNVLGIANCLEFCLPEMHNHGSGTVVLIGSLLDVRGYAGTASYSVSKAALRAVVDSARVLLRSSGINVVYVRPGFMRTAMTAQNSMHMPGMLTAEAAAYRILRGITRGKAVISFPRWLAAVADIARLLPRHIYERLVRRAMKMDGEAEPTYQPLDCEEYSNANA